MIFHADITFALALLALAAGALLIFLAKTKADKTTVTCKIIGFIIIVISALLILYSGHNMIKKHILRHVMMYNIIHQRKMMPCMMHHRMMCPHMQKKMQGMRPAPMRRGAKAR